MFEHTPAEFRAAYERGDEHVRLAIEAFAEPSTSCFLVCRAEFDSTSVRSVGMLFVRELVASATASQIALTGVMGDMRTYPVGALGDALRYPCPRCRGAGYLFCIEYADWKFDPDWHSDLYVLCTGCPHSERIVHDFSGFYAPASSL